MGGEDDRFSYSRRSVVETWKLIGKISVGADSSFGARLRPVNEIVPPDGWPALRASIIYDR